ncbi:MAG: alpha/beta hydrolase [Acidobacteriota bacterium]|nr:MAG: alpha/beta hydrolase [Acidobacteriota bacterium]
MNTKTRRYRSCVILWALLFCSSPLLAQESSRKIGPRTLPLSVGVSDAFRKSQAETPELDPSDMDFVPATEEEWIEHIEEKDAGAAAVAQSLAGALNVTVKEDKIAGVNVYWVNPPTISVEHQGHLFVYIHGGAYVYNGGMAGVVEPALIAHHLQIEVVSIDYRMPPQHPAPAATDDVIAVWKELLKTRSNTSMVMGGTSAGGNITLASSQRFVSLGLAVPAALYIGTPTVDLNPEAGDSRYLNEGADRILIKMGDFGVAAMNLYAGELGLNHPYVSPIFGSFSGLPPTYLITGTRDLLLSDTVRTHRALRRAGIVAELHVYEGQSHGDYILALKTPESAEHYAELQRFVLEHLSAPLATEPALSADQIPKEIPESVAF